jgi:hypothetical protein
MKRLIVSCLSTLLLVATTQKLASAQTIAQNPASSNVYQGTGNLLNYPSGTRIYNNGSLNVHNGTIIYPSVTINHSDGSSTYYYSNGTRITTDKNTVSPSGSFIIQSVNGGLNNGNRINPIQNQNLLNRNRCVPPLVGQSPVFLPNTVC